MTTTQEVTEAERGAAVAGAAVQAEMDIASGTRRGVTAATLNKLRDTFRHADLTAAGLRAKAERDRDAARLAGLEQIGQAADELARQAAGPSTLAAALQALVTASETIRAHAAAYDQQLAELIAAANDLGAEPPAPCGPQPSSARLAVTHAEIQHAETAISSLGPKVEAVISHAAAGQLDEAVALVNSAVVTRKPYRSDHYVRGSGGMISGMDDPLPAGILANLRNGELTELTRPQVDTYLAGALA